MSTVNWNDLKNKKYNSVIPKRFQQDALNENDKQQISDLFDKQVNNANFKAGRNNTFFNTVPRFINKEVEKYTELYFTQDDAEVLRVESDIQEAFFNAESEQQQEYTRRQKNNERVKMVHDALDSGIIIPDNVNIYDEEGQAYLRSQASEQGMTYEEYVRNAKKKKHAADKEDDRKKLSKQLEELAKMIIDGAGEIGDYNKYIEAIRAEHEELSRVQIENALIETLRITKQASEAATKASEEATKIADEVSEERERERKKRAAITASEAAEAASEAATKAADEASKQVEDVASTRIQKVARGVAERQKAIEENENTEVSQLKENRYKSLLDAFKKKAVESDWENRSKAKTSNPLSLNETKYNIYAIKQINENNYGVFAKKEGAQRKREYKFTFDEGAQTISYVPGTYLPKEVERKKLDFSGGGKKKRGKK